MKENMRMILELERLLEQGIENNRTQELRKALGIGKPETKDLSLVEKQYFRLKAFGLRDNEIAFALGTAPGKVIDLRDSYTSEELEERLKYYAEHKVIKNYNNQFKRKWKYSL